MPIPVHNMLANKKIADRISTVKGNRNWDSANKTVLYRIFFVELGPVNLVSNQNCKAPEQKPTINPIEITHYARMFKLCSKTGELPNMGIESLQETLSKSTRKKNAQRIKLPAPTNFCWPKSDLDLVPCDR